MSNCKLIVTELCLASFLLSGCAQYQWQKYGATQTDYHRDLYECQNESAKTYPTQMQVITTDIPQSSYVSSFSSCFGIFNCTTSSVQNNSGGGSTSGLIDVNATNRRVATKSCLYALGWQLIRVK